MSICACFRCDLRGSPSHRASAECYDYLRTGEGATDLTRLVRVYDALNDSVSTSDGNKGTESNSEAMQPANCLLLPVGSMVASIHVETHERRNDQLDNTS